MDPVPPMFPRRLRLLLHNVCGFKLGTGEQVGALHAGLKPDVVVMNEFEAGPEGDSMAAYLRGLLGKKGGEGEAHSPLGVRKFLRTTGEEAEVLGGFREELREDGWTGSVAFNPANPGKRLSFGNCLIQMSRDKSEAKQEPLQLLPRFSCSSPPLPSCRGSRSLQLPGGSKIVFRGAPYLIRRSALVSPLSLAPSLTVVATHLDHIDPSARREQMEGLLNSGILDAQEPTILMGDLNSLTRTDYSPQEWSQLEARHEEKGWCLSSDECSSLLQERGWQDCFASLHGELQGSSAKMTAHVGQGPVALLYRIDYAWMNAAAQDRWRLLACRVNSDIGGLSDHAVLVLDVEERERKGRM